MTSVAREHHVYTWHEGKWVHRERAESPEKAQQRADALNVNDPNPLRPSPKPTMKMRR
jgi:hypothetical protein